MKTRPNFFNNNSGEEVFDELKKTFLKLLEETKLKCEKHTHNKEDQERYVSIIIVPHLEAEKAAASNSYKKIKSELAIIDRADKKDKCKFLYDYASGLSELNFNGLFMVILTGKIQKHWLPKANERLATEQKTFSPK